jgi:hypothetical protein
MKISTGGRALARLAVLASCALGTNAGARAATLPAAAVTVILPLPSANSFDVAVAFGPNDGLLYVWNGANVFKQNAIDSNGFASISAIGPVTQSADPGPIAFSRNAAAILVGNGSGGFSPAGNANLVFGIPSAGGDNTTPIATVDFHYSFLAAPLGASNDKFFVNQGEATFTTSSVSVFDQLSGTNISVVQNIPGASTFMAIDGSGRLYVGVGFGPDRGELRRFSNSSLGTAYSSAIPLDWSSGELFNDLDNNSGAGMFFDARGFLFVGGPSGVTVFDPSGNFRLYENGGFTTVDYDPFGDRLFVRGFGNEQGIYDAAMLLVPEPTAAVLATCALIPFVLLVRRARRASAAG